MARSSFVFHCALWLFTLGATAPALATRPDEPGGASVRRLTFTVTLSDGNPYQIAGYYYARGGSHAHPLQVLVHGATYDHRYWDAGTLNGVDYSYARYMAERGYEVLAIDQLGAGESSKPFGYFLNLAETASGLHQVLASLRTADNPTGRAFHNIVLVGHSNGSLTAIYEEAHYHSADALVTTGWGHTFTPIDVDQEYFAQILSQPYLQPSAIPEPLRAALFYYLPETDPAMPGYDASVLATTMASGQFIDVLSYSAQPSSDGVAQVTGPVLVQLAEFDPIAPSVNAGLEPGYWTSASSVTVQGLDSMGHDMNLHLNRVDSWSRIDQWIRATVPSGGVRAN